MVYDSGRGRFVLFGGGGQNSMGQAIYLGDTWEYDETTATWSLIATTGNPPARSLHAMAYDSARGRTVLFGGFNNPPVYSFLSDTWEYDGATASWQQVSTKNTPPERMQHAMAYDTARSRVVLFGGNYNLGDTWEYDGATQNWSQISTANNPPSRNGHAMVYDSTRGRIVVFGGYSFVSSGFLGDTWEYDGSAGTWTETATAGPLARSEHAMAYDSDRGQVVLFGGNRLDYCHGVLGDTWEYNGSTASWSQITANASPLAREAHAMVYSHLRRTTVLFGGDNCAFTLFADTWNYNGAPANWSTPGLSCIGGKTCGCNSNADCVGPSTCNTTDHTCN